MRLCFFLVTAVLALPVSQGTSEPRPLLIIEPPQPPAITCANVLCSREASRCYESPDGPFCEAPKPGQCPKFRCLIPVTPNCENDCLSDFKGCPGSQKCCKGCNGCFQCLEAGTPDVCNNVHCPRGTVCKKQLTKCFGPECNPIAVCLPENTKPGVCPAADSEPTAGCSATSQCEDDKDCKGDDKCCFSPCGGKQCSAPLVAVNCNNVVCQNNQKCREVTVSGKDVSPQCVDNPPQFPKEEQCIDLTNPLLQLGSSGLDRFFCGRGGTQCPKGYSCNTSPIDKFAFCCRNQEPLCRPACGKGRECQQLTINCFTTPCPQPPPFCAATDRCLLVKDPGPCDGAFSRYFFNSETGQCEDFTYGGCQGNENNFQSKSDCESSCEKFISKPGTCDASSNLIGSCVNECPDDSSCPGNQKCCHTSCGGTSCFEPFPGKLTCKDKVCDDGFVCNPNPPECRSIPCDEGPVCTSKVVCQLERKVGPCRAAVPRYFFNSATGQCQNFSWGGCQPNGNNFLTQEDCEAVCESSSVKEGSCPANPPGIITPCVSRCSTDQSCPGEQKCCNRGCGQFCLKPVITNPPSTKPGNCPLFSGENFGNCASQCGSDNECPGLQKCCGNGCGTECRNPSPSFTLPKTCFDLDCGSESICILETSDCVGGPCNIEPKCIPKRKAPKLGSCPPVPKGTAGTCVQQCSSDSNCEGEKKCCSNGCGNICRSPFTGNKRPSTTCRGKICPAGEACVLEKACKISEKSIDCVTFPNCVPEENAGILNQRLNILAYSQPDALSGLVIEEDSKDNESNLPSRLDLTILPAPKDGFCPPVLPGTVGICITECSADMQCPDDKKCCGNGCGQVCTSPVNATVDVCLLPKQPGPCKAFLPSFYYDVNSRKCKKFVYGGCQGNANRFPTKKSCKKACRQRFSCPKLEDDSLLFCITRPKCKLSGKLDCPDQFTCCKTRCGRRCLKAVVNN